MKGKCGDVKMEGNAISQIHFNFGFRFILKNISNFHFHISTLAHFHIRILHYLNKHI